MTLFQKKINYIFENITEKNNRELVRLFSENRHTYNVRKKTVINKWLYGEMKELPKWNYNRYPIKTEYFFPENSFSDEEDFETFKERVDRFTLNSSYNSVSSKLNSTILKLKSDYREIENISQSLNRFLKYYEDKGSLIPDNLVGTWYHRYYGSEKNDDGLKVWNLELNIYSSGDVEYLYNGEVMLKGEINTTFNKKHYFIYLTSVKSGTLILIKLDKDDIYRGIFKAPILDKKLSSTINMISFGFFSKENNMDESTIREILGSEDNILIEDEDMQKRIIEYYNQQAFNLTSSTS
jgi:hypothetical protein